MDELERRKNLIKQSSNGINASDLFKITACWHRYHHINTDMWLALDLYIKEICNV